MSSNPPPVNHDFVTFNSGAAVITVPIRAICRIEQYPSAGMVSLLTGDGGMQSCRWDVPARQVASVLLTLRAAGWPMVEMEAVDE